MTTGSADLATLDATAQAELVRDREVTPAELVEAAIERIERSTRRSTRSSPRSSSGAVEAAADER